MTFYCINNMYLIFLPPLVDNQVATEFISFMILFELSAPNISDYRHQLLKMAIHLTGIQ